jgi:YggT family protein
LPAEKEVAMQERVEQTHIEDEDGVIEERVVHQVEPVVNYEAVGDRVSTSRWESHDATLARQRQASAIIHGVYWVFGVVGSLIGIRIVLKLLAANPNNAFADFMYGITAPFVAPFAGIFATPSSNGYVFEMHSVLALVIYALLAVLITSLIRLLFYPKPVA